MPSKGVDYYGYIDGNQKVAFSGPKVGSTLTVADNFKKNNLQIDSHNIPGPLDFVGRFAWVASDGYGTQFSTQSLDINSLTGNIAGGTMTTMMETPPVSAVDANGCVNTVCYGFYDSGPGWSGLTNQDQSYVYVTSGLQDWMASGVAYYNAYHTKDAGEFPFYKFVLPGAHDAGMNTMSTVSSVLYSPEGAAMVSAVAYAFPLLAAFTVAEAPYVLLNAAMTQKDGTTDMLNLGARYFDFRPGTMYKGITGFSGERFHQHAVVPGQSYVKFLEEVLTWLAAHKGEIVVVSCNTQGFGDDAMKPTVADLNGDYQTAVSNSGIGNIALGDKTSLGKTYNQLVKENRRLIFLNQINGETTKYDSYEGDLYATTDPNNVIKALAKMNTAGQAGFDYTVLQLQGTATGIPSVQKGGLFSLSKTASPLMSTKAKFDATTIPWVRQNAYANLQAPQPLVLLNDFVETATVEAAWCLTVDRWGWDSSEEAFEAGQAFRKVPEGQAA